MNPLAFRKIVSVTLDDGSTVEVSDADLRGYLEVRDLQARAKKRGFTVHDMALNEWVRKLARDWNRVQTLRTKAAQTHSADAKRTEKALRAAEKSLIKRGTPPHRVRTLAAQAAGVSRARADQIFGPVGKRRKSKAPS